MAEKLIVLVLFLANTVVSNPVSNKTYEASDDCRGEEAMGRLEITSQPFYVPLLQGGWSIMLEDWMLDDDNPKKEKPWEVFDYYRDGGTTLEGLDRDTTQPFYDEDNVDNDIPQEEASEDYRGGRTPLEGLDRDTTQPFHDEEYPDDDNPKLEESWEALDDYMADGTNLEGLDWETTQPIYGGYNFDGENPIEKSSEDYSGSGTTLEGVDRDTTQLIYSEDNLDDNNSNSLASLFAFRRANYASAIKNKTNDNPQEYDYESWLIHIPMSVVICIVVIVFFSFFCICIRKKKARDHKKQLAKAKKKSNKYLEDLKKVHGSNPKIMQQINNIENHRGPLNFSTDPRDSKANPSLDSIAMIKVANKEKNDAQRPEEDGKGFNVEAEEASDAVHRRPSDVTNGLPSIDASPLSMSKFSPIDASKTCYVIEMLDMPESRYSKKYKSACDRPKRKHENRDDRHTKVRSAHFQKIGDEQEVKFKTLKNQTKYKGISDLERGETFVKELLFHRGQETSPVVQETSPVVWL